VTPKTLARKIAAAALHKKAYDITIMDLRKITSMTDYFVVCSVDSDTQARAVADSIKHETMEKGESLVRKEGYTEGRWILLDYVDVVAHVFHKDIRAFYNLEKLWGDAKFEHISDTLAESKVSSEGSQKPKKKPVRRKTSSK
jgi:ribosome-associated protein